MEGIDKPILSFGNEGSCEKHQRIKNYTKLIYPNNSDKQDELYWRIAGHFRNFPLKSA